jgi:hypothetical protein
VDTIKEMHDGLTARLGIVVSTLLKKLKKPKSVTQNVEGALVKGKAWNICQSRTESLFLHGFNKLQPDMQ